MAARVGDAPSIGLGPLLRWVAALAGLRSASRVADIPGVLTRLVVEVEGALRQVSGVRIVPGASLAMCEATGWPSSIVTFTMDRRRDAGQLSIEGLRPVYEGLAGAGALLGQPVSLGRSGGLRVALSARPIGRSGRREAGPARVRARRRRRRMNRHLHAETAKSRL